MTNITHTKEVFVRCPHIKQHLWTGTVLKLLQITLGPPIRIKLVRRRQQVRKYFNQIGLWQCFSEVFNFEQRLVYMKNWRDFLTSTIGHNLVLHQIHCDYWFHLKFKLGFHQNDNSSKSRISNIKPKYRKLNFIIKVQVKLNALKLMFWNDPGLGTLVDFQKK